MPFLKKAIVPLLLLAVAAGLWWWGRSDSRGLAPAMDVPTPEGAGISAPPADSPATAPAPSGPGRYAPLDRLHDPAQTVQDDLRILNDLFIHYQIAVKDPSGNPVGTNEEIVRALQGRNRARLAFLPAGHPAVDGAGRLCDRWGTPFFFHALSGTRMEIRSAGPDRRLYTADDAVTRGN